MVSPETAGKLRTMLTAVTQDARGQRGTGPQAAVPGYEVAGKTGTAQQVDPACGCYSASTYWITFAGHVPCRRTRATSSAIMLDAPGGGASAAPLFHDIATYLAQREKLPVSLEPPRGPDARGALRGLTVTPARAHAGPGSRVGEWSCADGGWSGPDHDRRRGTLVRRLSGRPHRDVDHRWRRGGHRQAVAPRRRGARRPVRSVRPVGRAVGTSACGTGDAREGLPGRAGNLRDVPTAHSAAAPAAALPPRPRSQPPVELTAVAAAVGVPAPARGTTVTGVTLRASEVRPGDLFAALPGSRAHGADFAAAALAAGAAAVLTDAAGAARITGAACAGPGPGGVPVLVHPRPREVLGVAASRIYGHPTARLSVLGVTGTSGKTTVAHLLEAGLVAAGRATGLLGTVGTRIGGHTLPSAFTTPEAPDLQALFGVMAESGVTDVAMEVSSHALAMGRVAGTRFAVAAFTNLSQDHLDFHRDMESYFEAKAALFDGRARHGVICVDDRWGRALAERTPHAVTVSATGAEAGWRATGAATAPDGTQTFTAVGPDGAAQPVRLQLPGAFNIANALVALACLDAVDVPPAVAAAGFADLAVPGRMQRVEAGQPFLAVVDYAHKPAAVAALLDTLRAQVPGRLIVVLGCGGDRDRGKRPLMGAAAAARAEVLVVTDDNPRTEEPASIRAAMLAGARAEPGHGDVLEIGDRRTAIAAAVASARPGDAVVVAGKGHETGQEIHGVKHPFDDVAELAAAIGAARS